MVFQNVFLFADSIENNIKFGKPDATHEEVVRAAKSACCHDFIMALPNGYDTVIGESGATLSGGEKQRISIARAILKDTLSLIHIFKLPRGSARSFMRSNTANLLKRPFDKYKITERNETR